MKLLNDFLLIAKIHRYAAALTALGILFALAGCGIAPSVPATASSGQPIVSPAGKSGLQGSVHGGFGPVTGTTVQLYEVGTTGYSSAAKPILTTPVTSDAKNGSFTISGDYNCDANSYVYITASGGNAGGGTNANLALMAALGSCSQLKANAATTSLVVNEVTTVAAAYALAQFATSTRFGTPLTSQPGSGGVTAPADNFATSATNVQGLANAMAVASVLANTSNGSSPGNNLNGTATVESYMVNTIANILAACVDTNGGTTASTLCGKIFAAATPLGGVQPADTIQVALQLALHPGDANLLAGTVSGNTLDSFISAQGPYAPYVNTSPATAPAVNLNTINDWTIGISYAPVVPSSTTTLLGRTNSVAIDGFGNAWITNIGTTPNSVVEVGPTGDPILSGSTGSSYSVSSYKLYYAAYNVVGGANATGELFGIALDTNNNAWASDLNGGYLFEITHSGAQIGTSGEVATNHGGGGVDSISYLTDSTLAHPTGVAIDGGNNVYAALWGTGGTAPAGGSGCGTYTSGTQNLVFFPNTSGTYGAAVFSSAGGSNQSNVVIDSATYDTIGGSPIPGAPFLWWLAEGSNPGEVHPTGGTSGNYGMLFQSYAGTTGPNPQGCNTPVTSITTTAFTPTTKLPTLANGGDAEDLFNDASILAVDHGNNLWTVNQLATDAKGQNAHSFTKITPGYGTSTFMNSTFAANTSFVEYTTGGMLASGYKPFYLVVDGGGNVFAPSNGSEPQVAAVSNTGAALAPSTGLTGSVYSADQVHTSARNFGVASGAAIDASGNLWITNGTAGSTKIEQIVGVAVPVAVPMSYAQGNNLIGAKP